MVGGMLGPAEVVEVPEPAADVIDGDVVVDADGTVPFPNIYMFNRLGPPQYSVWLLLQAILQSVAAALTEPVPSLLSQ